MISIRRAFSAGRAQSVTASNGSLKREVPGGREGITTLKGPTTLHATVAAERR